MVDVPFISQKTPYINKIIEDAYVRIGVITKINPLDGICEVRYLDGMTSNSFVPVTFPMTGGDGWGIYAMPTPGTLAAIAYRPDREAIIVGYVALDWLNYLRTNSSPESFTGGSPIPPKLFPGEIDLHSKGGADVIMPLNGSVIMMAKTPLHRVIVDEDGHAVRAESNTVICMGHTTSGLAITQCGELRRLPATVDELASQPGGGLGNTIQRSAVPMPDIIDITGWLTTVSEGSKLIGAISIEQDSADGISGLPKNIRDIPNPLSGAMSSDIGLQSSQKPAITIRTPKASIDILHDGKVVIKTKSLGVAVEDKVSLHTESTNIVSSKDVTVTSEQVTINGDVTVNGNVEVNGKVTAHGGIITPTVTNDDKSGKDIVFNANDVIFPKILVKNLGEINRLSVFSTAKIGSHLQVNGNIAAQGIMTESGGRLVARIGDPVTVMTPQGPGSGTISGRS